MGEDFAVSTNVRIAADRKDGNYNIKGLPAGAYKLTELWSDNGVTHQGSAFISAGQLAFGQAAITEIKPYTVTGSIRYPTPRLMERSTLSSNRQQPMIRTVIPPLSKPTGLFR